MEPFFKLAKLFLRDAFNLEKFEINLMIEKQIEIIKKTEIKSNGWTGIGPSLD